MAGGDLFRSFLEASLVDVVEVAVVPILLGKGIPMLPEVASRTHLRLSESTQSKSGLVLNGYDVIRHT